jgi:hypothetical protein
MRLLTLKRFQQPLHGYNGSVDCLPNSGHALLLANQGNNRRAKVDMNKAVKAVGVGLVAGGLLLATPAGIAFADGGLSDAVGGVNGAVQNVVNQNNKGLQGITAINNGGLQSNTSLNNSGLQNGVGSLNAWLQSFFGK